MDKKSIPSEVTATAKRLFPHGAVLVGVVDDKQVFSAAKDPSRKGSEPAAPTGLPTYIVWDGRKVEVVSGLESIELLSRLQ